MAELAVPRMSIISTAVYSAEEDAVQPLVSTGKADTLSIVCCYRDCTMRRHGTRSFLALLAACFLTASPVWDGARAQGASPVKVPQSQDECDDLFLDFDMTIAKTLSAGAQTKILRDQGYNRLIPQLCKDGKYQEVYDLLIGYLRPPPQKGCVPGSFLCDR